LIVCYRVSGQRMSQIAQIGLVGAAPGGTMLPLNGAAQEAFRSRRTVVLDPLPESRASATTRSWQQGVRELSR